MADPQTAEIDFSQPPPVAIDFSQPPPAATGLGMYGRSLTNANAIPNARLRNMPNPAAGETSDLGALYHGAKMGATLASIPAAASLTPASAVRMLAGGTVGTIAGQQIAKAAGAEGLGQEAAGDVGGLLGAGLTEGAYSAAKARLQSVYDALPKAVQDEVKSQAIGALSPRAKHVLGFIKALNAEYAPTSEAASPELAQAASLRRGPQVVTDPAAGLGQIPIKTPGQAGSIAQSVVAPTSPTPSNFPTAASRAASDAAFARNFPNETMPEGMTPQEKEIWQERMFGEKPPEDIGTVQRNKYPEPTRAEVKAAQQRITPEMVEQEAQKAVGYKPPTPGAPIVPREMRSSGNPKLPEGFMSALNSKGEPSSVLSGYKYDASAKEFTAATRTGNVQYVYGDVSPEDVAAFDKAESKGKAWQDIRQNPLVAKIVDGKRIPVKPGRSIVVNPETGKPEFSDMTDALKKSVQAAKAKKLSTATDTP